MVWSKSATKRCTVVLPVAVELVTGLVELPGDRDTRRLVNSTLGLGLCVGRSTTNPGTLFKQERY
jgi:hypothetical protein